MLLAQLLELFLGASLDGVKAFVKENPRALEEMDAKFILHEILRFDEASRKYRTSCKCIHAA